MSEETLAAIVVPYAMIVMFLWIPGIFMLEDDGIDGREWLRYMGLSLLWPIGAVVFIRAFIKDRKSPGRDRFIYTIRPIDGPRATIKPEEREAFDASVKHLLGQAKQRTYGRATTIDGKRSGVSGEQRDIYQQNVAHMREQAKRSTDG